MANPSGVLDPEMAALTLEAILQAYADYNSPPTPPYVPSPPSGYSSYYFRFFGWEGIFSPSMVKFGLIFQALPVSGQYLVAFRGTQTDTEWILDFDWSKVPCSQDPQVEIASGFDRIYNGSDDDGAGLRCLPSMRAQLRDWLTQTQPTDLIITGHSLGGAVASLFAYDLLQGGFPGLPIPTVSVITYASPNVGTSSWQSAYNATVPESVRVYNSDDVVPYAPPDEFFGYLPVGTDWPVEFEPSDWFNQYLPDALGTNHSADNYQYVVNLAAPNGPPVWSGHFADQSGLTSWLMQSWAPSGDRGARRLELLYQHLKQMRAIGSHSRSGPVQAE